MTIRATEDGTVRNDPATPADFGLVVRVASDGATTFGVYQNGARTTTPASGAVLVLANNPIAAGLPGSRIAAIVQNVGGANVCVGVAGVVATTGLVLPPLGIMIIERPNVYPGEIWAIGEAADSIVFTQEILLS